MKRVRNVPVLPPRRADAHKGNFGRVLMLAGSRGMVGAAAMAGDSALRAGAGLVTIGTPQSVYPLLAVKVTCCMTHPFAETPDGTLSDAAADEIQQYAEAFDVVAIGPGLGRHPGTTKLVHRLLRNLAKPMVIDADGLFALAEDSTALARPPAPRILTPHPGEMSRLVGLTQREVQKARSGVAFWFAREHNCVVALKGRETVVSDGERLYVNTTGNPGMATGGTGDVLTGVIAGLLGQKLDPFDAAVLGVYIHGLAGDLAAREVGEVSLIATDVMAFLPRAFLEHAARPPRRKETR